MTGLVSLSCAYRKVSRWARATALMVASVPGLGGGEGQGEGLCDEERGR